MTMTLSISIIAGVLAAIGLAGIMVGASGQRTPWRARTFRTGSIAMGSAGLVLLLGGLLGVADTGQIFGGLMLLIFGTAVSLPATKGTVTPVTPESAPTA